ncbi:glycosyltransferase family 39 protein [Fructilactobacillus fructivorans]|uniref:glycosyltransferase family 39 protein n=1 Tax=Fructilactobacillus fructivorans TaxID=1614 RepID=UPI000704C1CF|nr:glycosyltransferase family 39 protein [Fructilactobacillus fructivorans]KRN42753.1 teichoic acid polysaccharide glycosyl transferase [Fructilactobacillus fructivorans]
MLKKLKTKPYLFGLTFVVMSIIIILLLSFASPFYYFDTSPDSNNFFTVGKAMFHGIIPYKDVFEQKGPFVYLIYGLSSLLTKRSLVGMMPFEIIAMIIIMTMAYKIARLYLSQNWSFVISLFMPVFAVLQPFYDYGGSVEFFVFPAVLYLIYVALKASQNHFDIKWWEWMIQGFMVGVVFFSKYTLLGPWVGFYVFMFIFYVYHRRFKEMWRLILFSGLSFLIALVPWLIYFAVTGSLKAFIHVYFTINMTVYGSSGIVPTKILIAAGFFMKFLTQYPITVVFGLLGLIYVLFDHEIFKNGISKSLFLFMMIVNAIVSVYGHTFGKIYQYYQLAYFPFIMVTTIFLLVFFIRHFESNRKLALPWTFVAVALCMALTFVLGSNNNFIYSKLHPQNLYVTLNPKKGQYQQPAQVSFGKIIRDESKGTPTLLTYSRLENGFYTSSGAYPTHYFFERNNIPSRAYPRMMRSANKVVQKKQVQWLVIRVDNTSGKNNDKLYSYMSSGSRKGGRDALIKNYRLRSSHAQMFEARRATYYLFEARTKSNPKAKKMIKEHKFY